MTALTSTLTAASKQWASRPADERFTSLPDPPPIHCRPRPTGLGAEKRWTLD